MRDVNAHTTAQDVPGAKGEEAHTAPFDLFVAARGLQTPTWIYDIDHCRVTFANPAACKMWQAETEEELRARDLSKDMSPTVAKRLKQYQTDFETRDVVFHEMWTLYPNGEPTSSMVLFRGFRLADGRMAMQCEVLGTAEDQPDNLRSAEALLHTDVMIALYSEDGPALYMNPAARNVANTPKGTLASLFVDPRDYEIMMFELDGKGEYRMVAKVKTARGEAWFDLSAKTCSDAVTGKPAILLTAFDVSELKVARDKARYLANRDQLTGCYNRAFLQQYLKKLVHRGSSQCALLYFDVDRFKLINDTFGHETGDRVLQELGHRAQTAVNEDDLVARLGGDEFVVVLDSIDKGRDLDAQVERLFSALSKPVYHGATSVAVNVSMGVARFDPMQVDLESVLRDADVALYVSKQNGRDQYTFYSHEMGEAAKERRKLEQEIKAALSKREFVLHFQPRVDVRSGRIVSVEGLVRWQHPERGLIMPDQFIPVCEQTGMIEELGQQVLEMGFAQALDWYQSGQELHMSLNISPRQFTDDRLMQTLERFAASPNFPKNRIELEVTENVLIGDLDGITNKLLDITALGYQIAIDDFGTGYSNLSYISRIPLTCLKIDRSFINQLPKSGPIVNLILALAKQIEATIVAEGVETDAQYDWLAQNGCDQIQGYLIAKPLGVAELSQLLQNDQLYSAK